MWLFSAMKENRERRVIGGGIRSYGSPSQCDRPQVDFEIVEAFSILQ